MARITVEDCLEKVDNQYELVLLAKERAAQLNSGVTPEVPEENDKKTVIALREIGEGKVSTKDLGDSAINKLRENPEDATSSENLDAIESDDFEKLYKGEVSKSGVAILPSKRVRKIVNKISSTDNESKAGADIEKKQSEPLEQKEVEEVPKPLENETSVQASENKEK